jgi:hypothetical protein
MEDPSVQLMKIRALMDLLPGTIALGGDSDLWAKLFVGTNADNEAFIGTFGLPHDPDPVGEWEVCNIQMHKCFSYGITSNQLASQIRRGPKGVLAMVNFLTFMLKHQVDLSPLDGCLRLLIDALGEWYGLMTLMFPFDFSLSSLLSGAHLPNNW